MSKRKIPRITSVDFDGTLCENKWPDIGDPNGELLYILITRRAAGEKVILWTCRTGKRLEEAVAWCHDHLLDFDAVNENLPEVIEWMGGDSRKIYADEYIDDRNATFARRFNNEEWKIPTKEWVREPYFGPNVFNLD